MTKDELLQELTDIRNLYINNPDRARFMAEQKMLEYIDDQRVTDIVDSL